MGAPTPILGTTSWGNEGQDIGDRQPSEMMFP